MHTVKTAFVLSTRVSFEITGRSMVSGDKTIRVLTYV
jgi:hypothetical protein